MAKFTSLAKKGRGGFKPAFLNDFTGDEVMGSTPELTPHMARKFDEETVLHVRDTVLPEAIEANDVKVVRACEDLLQSWGMAIPNHVSGRWEPSDVPRNEMMLREMFAHRMPEYGYEIIRSRAAFPDWLLRNAKGDFVYAEIEHRSSSFRLHEHDPRLCDLVICWEHDEPSLGVPVLELFSGRIYEPKEPVETGDRSRLFATGVQSKGMERTRKQVNVEARQKFIVETFRENIKVLKRKGASVRKTAEQTGYSQSYVYQLLSRLDE